MMPLHYMRYNSLGSHMLFSCNQIDLGWQCRKTRKRRSDASYPHQRSLQFILAYVPTTASSAQLCLLCCQPEPVPGALTARMSLFTLRDPCRLLVWSG